jgi:superfamily II DNA/RNA helicase
MAAKIKKSKPGKRTVKTSNSIGTGWITTDEEEIERRRLRALEEELQVKTIKINGRQPKTIYCNYLVSSANGRYEVELRDKQQPVNSCECPDFQINQLGTCKHIERVTRAVARKKAPIKRSCTEIFVNPTQQTVEILWADDLRRNSKVSKTLSGYFSSDNQLLVPTTDSLRALQRSILQAKLDIDQVRISRYVHSWLESKERPQKAIQERNCYLKDVRQNKRSANVVSLPLYDYQREGMLHLAFKRRAILADEMGLGKTVQAIAACELLRQLKGIERVLVICPVSLKTEWEEQISKFTQLSSLIIQGNRTDRLKHYQDESFFYLANYEQLLYDYDEIQTILAPDVIIFDEAQRVKNWQTKTAQTIKRLNSPYAFVLTGTPLENRIDEIYSITQLVDPNIFGPLFRFNRDYYQLDENGKPLGYKNLDQLHQKLRPVLLRRRKHDVEDELPERVSSNYFVGMHEEQELRYSEYEAAVARLMHKAQHSALSPEEHKLLQLKLSCMRMVCDSPYILDQTCRISPKLDELETILGELLEDPENKIIIFSEWVRMLELIQQHLDQIGIDYALHTGQVNQKKRRLEINRFKEAAECRVFLSSDSGATGLNLQVANIVINMDLPWNPAKLEQRIARAWRKQQKKQVRVINLVCKDSIEHRILSILKHKSQLAEGVLDGNGEPNMDLPSGRKIMIEQLEQVLGTRVRHEDEDRQDGSKAEPATALYQEVEAKHPQLLNRLAVYENDSGKSTLLAVVNGQREDQAKQLQQIVQTHPDAANELEVIDTGTLEVIQRLIDAGVLSLNQPSQNLLAAPNATDEKTLHRQWAEKAQTIYEQAERKFDMAKLLFNGGFEQEAVTPLTESIEKVQESICYCETGKLQDSHASKEHQIPERLKEIMNLNEKPRAEDITEAEEFLKEISEYLISRVLK